VHIAKFRAESLLSSSKTQNIILTAAERKWQPDFLQTTGWIGPTIGHWVESINLLPGTLLDTVV
jgi:hypothetical protein